MVRGFYLKFTTVYAPLLDLIKIYKEYLNTLMLKSSFPLYIELIQDGYILIFESFEDCRKHYNHKYSASPDPSKNITENSISTMYRGMKEIEAFPSEGIDLILETEPRYLNKMYILLSQKYSTFSQKVELKRLPQEKMIIHFATKLALLEFISKTATHSEGMGRSG